MDTIQTLLTLDSSWSDKELLDRLDKIADTLFNSGLINNGQESYELLELEFYVVHPNFCDEVTYKREWKQPGELLYHYSGIDICFASNTDIMGGVLIRSVHKIDAAHNDGIICGPLKLKDVLLNNASQKLEFILSSQPRTEHVIYDKTNRINVPYDKEKDVKLRFVRRDYHGVSIVDSETSPDRLKVIYKLK